MAAMRLSCLVAAAIALLSSEAAAMQAAARDARERFVLCSNPPASGYRIVVDYRSGWGLLDDMQMPLTRCRSARRCIDFPFVLSAPPRFPSGPSEVVTWQANAHLFSLRADARRPGQYLISAMRVSNGNRRAPGDRNAVSYVYSEARGLISVRLSPRVPELVLCRGRFTFADIDTLSPASPASVPPDLVLE
jgi:hypothetical protein